ncbi:hypothetical protein, partial [Vibrio cholerae]|uniref:hypothetical protein n=1 Tax=Vibrio cholerae TaxID=666 RepID=UPI0030804E2F
IYKLILNFIGLHQKTEIKEALVANSKHHRSPYISTTFMRFPCLQQWFTVIRIKNSQIVEQGTLTKSTTPPL